MEHVATVDALREALGSLKLDTRGHKAVLKKRLRTAKKVQSEASKASLQHIEESLKPRRPASQNFDSYLVLDFEATCQQHVAGQGSRFDFPNEIIEFPVLLLQWRRKTTNMSDKGAPTDNTSSDSCEEQDVDSEEEGDHAWTLEVVDEFRRFVRPTWRPKLSDFCTDLTGITQEDIDQADDFVQVLQEFRASFIQPYKLFTKYNKTTWVTDGQWDLRDFVAKQCYISSITRPTWLKGSYVDLRSSATAYLSRKLPVVVEPVESTETLHNEIYVTIIDPKPTVLVPTTRGLASPNIPAVLKALGLEPFEGRQHSGIDDVKNIARILQELVKPERNWRVEANAKIEGRDKTWYWMKSNGGVAWKHALED